MIPWKNHTLIGTTDVPVSEPIRDSHASSQEIDYLLDLSSQYLNTPPKREDILSVFSGIRPLVKSSSGIKTASLSRSHRVMLSASGLITLAGGKWTTGRKMAEDTIDKALKVSDTKISPCKTKELFFPPSKTRNSHNTIHPDLTITWEDIEEATLNEMAQNIGDILARRTRSLFINSQASIDIAPIVAKKMASLLNKDENWIRKQTEDFKKLSASFQLS